MRKLIINADDFGLTTGVNSAISECAERGVLRSATIMANGPAFDDAVRTAKNTADLGVGIHFVLTGLKPLSSPETLPELAGRTGIFPSSPWELLKTVFTKKRVREEIKKELLVQTEKVFDSGITPTHFDTHKHVHIIPAVLDVLLEIANRFSVNWIRNPFDSPGAWRFLFDIEKNRRGEFLKQYGNVLCSRVSRHSFMSRVRGSAVRTPQSFHGVSVTGIMNEKVLARMAENLEPGINELMTHPGILDTDLAQQKTRLLRSREVEKDLLLSETVKRAFDNNGIVLSNFGEVNL
jgi:chitin disaccharide deacetylase